MIFVANFVPPSTVSAFGVRISQSVQNASIFVELLDEKKFRAWNAFFGPFLRLKGAIGSFFQAFSAEKSQNFDFLTKIQMTQNGTQMHQITLKTLFLHSRRLVDMIQYLGGAPTTYIGVCMAPWKMVDDATFGPKIDIFAKHAIFQLQTVFFDLLQ